MSGINILTIPNSKSGIEGIKNFLVNQETSSILVKTPTDTQLIPPEISDEGNELIYNGKVQYAPLVGVDTNTMTIANDTSINCDTIATYVTPKAGYSWDEDGKDTSSKGYIWHVVKRVLDKPRAYGKYTYTGSLITCNTTLYNSDYITKSGTYLATDTGTYTVTFSLSSTYNLEWSDGTTDDVSSTWSILPTTTLIPRVGSSYSYTGSNITCTFSNCDTRYISISGTRAATSKGTYTITFSLSSPTNVTWEDGTTENKSFQWSIV